MGLKLDKARDIVNKFPNTPKAALGRLLFKENPATYKDEEEARGYVRKATGSYGTKTRMDLKPIVKQEKYPNGKIYNPYNLPEEEHFDTSPYKLNVKPGDKVGLLCDIHMPYQHNQALTTAINWLKKQNVKYLVLNGDLIDCYTISNFGRDPEKRSFPEEIRLVKQFLVTLKKHFKGKIVFKEGNHEERYLRFLRSKAPELLGFEVLSFPNLLNLKELDIDFVSNKKVIQCGKMNIVHGHEFGQQIFSPVNPARGLFLRAKTNAIAGHHHITSSHSENTLERKPLATYSVGCLCELTPEYRPLNNCNHGVACIEIVSNDGWFIVENKKIINGKIY